MKTKIAGIVLIVLAAVVALVYGIVAAVTFGRGDYGVYSGAPAPEARPAELAYNTLRYASGAYKYSVQVYVDIDRMTEGMSLQDKARLEITASDAVRAAEEHMRGLGARIENDDDPYYFSAVTMEFSSATAMDIALGNDGYDVYTSSAEIYRGFWYMDYVSALSDPFATEGTYLSEVTDILTEALGAENIDLIYNYGSAYGTRTIETNAGYVYLFRDGADMDETYVHEFRRGADEEGKEMTVVQHSPNTVSFYLTIIDAVLLTTGIVFVAVGIGAGTRSDQ